MQQRRTPSVKEKQPFNTRSMDDLLAFLDGPHTEGNECFVCVIIHNIDGPGLRDSDTQHYLARIAACSHIRMVASIDHVNAPLCKLIFLMIHFSCSFSVGCFSGRKTKTMNENRRI